MDREKFTKDQPLTSFERAKQEALLERKVVEGFEALASLWFSMNPDSKYLPTWLSQVYFTCAEEMDILSVKFERCL